MHWHLEVLPPAQRRLWDELGATPQQFTLYGGTALALRFGHRTSVDFDFFTNEVFDVDALYLQVPYLAGSEIYHRSTVGLQCIVDRDGPVNVSFFGGLNMGQVALPETSPNGIKVAGLLDIAATKLKVILQRPARKDYEDIAALLASGLELTEMLAACQYVFGPLVPPLLSLKALVSFEDGDLPNLPSAVKQRILEAVAGVNLQRLQEDIERHQEAFKK